MDDTEFEAALAELGITRSPGMAKRMLAELAPLLAADGIDLDDLDGTDLETLNAAMARARERRNLELLTPVGADRTRTLDVLRRLSLATAQGDQEDATSILAEVAPEPTADRPAISHVIGVALGLLDTWHTEPALAPMLAVTSTPRWARSARSAGTDVLALARKGRAFDSLEALHRRHSGLQIYEGSALAVAASIATVAAREQLTPGAAADRMLGGGARSAAPPPRSKRTASGSLADRAALSGFRAWLRRVPEMDADEVSAEAADLEALFTASRSVDIDPGDPLRIDEIADLLLADDHLEHAERTRLLQTLEDYVRFRTETEAEPGPWRAALAEVDAAFDYLEPDPLAEVVRAADAIDPEVRRAAFAATRAISAVPELLDWIGTSRPVTQTGGVRRADIERVAAMIGVSAVGVSRLPPVEYDDADVALDAPLPILEPIPALSMSDVAPLEAWWAALETAEIIELTATRVRPGPAADQARASVVPLELCELVVACVVAEALTSELRASAYFADQVLAVAVSRLLNALDPSLKITESAEALFGGLLVPRALSLIAHLERLGLAQLLPGGGCVVPPELRGAVARGIILALRYIDEVFGPEPPLVE